MKKRARRPSWALRTRRQLRSFVGREHRPPSLRRAAYRAAGRTAVGVGFVVSATATAALLPPATHITFPEQLPSREAHPTPPLDHSGKGTVEEKVEGLVRRHACWRDGEQPTQAIPGHAVVARPTRGVDPSADDDRPVGNSPVLVGPEGTAKALEQLFAGVDHGMVVYAFCP